MGNILTNETDALASALTTGEGIPKAKKRLLEASHRATPEERDEAVRRLSALILLDHPKNAATAAIVCGSLVETGGDPSPMVQPLLSRFLPAVERFAAQPILE